ncbi:MAG: PEP-CTERM sorting domain-containing protein [Kiritimatiellales bacterium]
MQKRRSILIIAALAGFAGLTYASVVTHIDQDFSGFTTGTINTNPSGWGGLNSANLNVEIEEESGDKYMTIGRTGPGAVTYTSAMGGNTALNIDTTKSGEYKWSFDFCIDPSTPTASGSVTYIYLDSGSGKTFASLFLRKEASGFNVYVYNNLSDSYTASANNTLLTTIDVDEWYNVSFDIWTDGDTGHIGYDVTVGTDSLAVASQASLLTSDAVRMGWSPQMNGALISYDNILLQTVPEPATVGLFAISGLVALVWRKLHKS